MYTKDFDYNLPSSFIAQTPANPRDSSRLMVVDRRCQTWEHKYFYDLVDYLSKGDLLVWNNSKVFKARLFGEVQVDVESDDVDDKIELKMKKIGKILNIPKKVEIFLLRPTENKFVWRVLAKPGRKLRLGMKVKFASDFEGEIMMKEEDGTVLMQFAYDDMIVREKANMYGEVPTPPYVRNEQLTINNEQLSEMYQTVYAKSEGSVAAPTAGFHFTPELIEKLKNKGAQFAEVTLRVGFGTFQPVKTAKVEDHKMHSEWVELTAKNADLINQAKSEGRRVVAVGTTTVRTLEGIFQKFNSLCSFTGDLDIFITPGFKFQVIDALITNFHLPKSTLLMLVCAFVQDTDFALKCYQEAIKQKYRFYSFGDAMLIK